MDQVNESVDTILTLPSGVSAADISRACREAALEVLNHSQGWGKAELALWLTGSYALLTAHAASEGGPSSSSVWPVPLLRDIDARLVDRILRAARAEVIATLAAVAKDGSASFVLRALIAGTVARCEDAHGEPAWAPTGVATRLADRLLSLFAVDYLASPGDYETALVVCTSCETVCFDESQRAHGVCHMHGRNVAAIGGRRRNTLPYPPLEA